MSNCIEENKLAVINNCQSDSGCATHSQVSCCGSVDPAQQGLFNDDIEVKQRIYNEKKLIKENEQSYKKFSKDFNPVLWGISGLMIGTIVGTTVEQVLMIGADVTYTAIFGLFLGVTICINKNKANNQNQTDNL
jgi:hypothetical protein